MLPTRRQLRDRDLTQTPEEGSREADQFVARAPRARVDSGVDLQYAGTTLGAWVDVEGDEEPSASDVEGQRAYADWLSSFEPREERTGQGEHGLRLVEDQVHARSGERAA